MGTDYFGRVIYLNWESLNPLLVIISLIEMFQQYISHYWGDMKQSGVLEMPFQ